MWVPDRDASRRANSKAVKLIGGGVAGLVIFVAGVAAGGGSDTAPAASALSVPTATVTKTARATVKDAPTVTATATVTATETVRTKVVTTVTTVPRNKAGGGSGGGLDPRFSYCYEANDAGYGPYYRGMDPEYDWYDDRDNDGVVCES